jgi:hypothetical protein
LEQFLSGQILARFYDLGDAPVPDPAATIACRFYQ